MLGQMTTAVLAAILAVASAIQDQGGQTITGTNSTTGRPETITYRMTVLDSLQNDTELYNTTSGGVIIVGRSAKARSRALASDPPATDTKERANFRKGKIVNNPGSFGVGPETRIVNDPDGSFFPIRGFIPIVGISDKKPDRVSDFEYGSEAIYPGSSPPNRQGPEYIPEGFYPGKSGRKEPVYDSQNPSSFPQYPRKPHGPVQLPPIVRPETHRPQKSGTLFPDPSKANQGQQPYYRPVQPSPTTSGGGRPSKTSEEGRGHLGFGNGLGGPFVSGSDVPPEFPVAREECVCVPFYLCKNGYISAAQQGKGEGHLGQGPLGQGPNRQGPLVSGPGIHGPLRPGSPPFGDGLLIPIDERSNDKNFDAILDKDERQDNETEPVAQSRTRRQASNESRDIPDAPAYATDIMQRVLGVNFAHCGVLRTCCKVPSGGGVNIPSLNPVPLPPPQHLIPGPQFAPDINAASVIPPEILAQLFPKKPAFGAPQRIPTGGTYPIPNAVPFPGQRPPGNLIPFLPPQGSGQIYPKPQPYPQPRPEQPYRTCGVRNAFGVHGRVKNLHYPESGADFAEFPWQVGIMKRLGPQESLYVCGGTLIASQWIATAAHCLKTLRPQDIKIRLGEWDVHREDEFYAYVEKFAADIVIHPEFFPGNLNNDLALIRLDSPVDLNLPHIAAACLPEPRESFAGHRCWVTGWGKDAFGHQGEYQNILKKVDVPVIEHHDCQDRLRRTRLGPYYQLHPGFVCAGGEPGKDACTGDGGSPMVCEYNGVWKAVGLVSWGIGCGQPGVPGVYVNMALYRQWIDSVINGLG